MEEEEEEASGPTPRYPNHEELRVEQLQRVTPVLPVSDVRTQVVFNR